jgi:phospholipid/cholesterol/gamma-HCH transport system substrate-binding protein
MGQFPGLLRTTQEATDDLTAVAEALAPVAADLEAAAPGLSVALRELPATSRELRTLLPHLDGVLDTAPDTLGRVPVVAEDVRTLIPEASTALSDINPMLSYLSPYGRDLAGFLTTTGPAATETGNGWIARLALIYNEQTQRGLPVDSNDIIDRNNPYPEPESAEKPQPFSGDYPRVEREGNNDR